MIDSFHSSGSFCLFQIEIISLWISQLIVLPPALTLLTITVLKSMDFIVYGMQVLKENVRVA
jgi:hypothetical protein